MTVVLSEAAITKLFETPQGPVARFVERVADEVVAEARANIRDYFGTAPSLHGTVDQEVGVDMEGSDATVGIRDGGNKSRRLAAYQADGSFNWLQRALDTVRARFGR